MSKMIEKKKIIINVSLIDQTAWLTRLFLR